MTSKEFIDYIKSFNKLPGEYTEDEIYDICMIHKSLLKEDKNWNELANILGVNRTGEQLRLYIVNQQRKRGELKSNPSIVKDVDLINLSVETASDVLDAKMLELQKQQVKTRDETTQYRKLIRQTARVESFIQDIKDVVSKLNDLPLPIHKLEENNSLSLFDTEAVLLLSDFHIGAYCDNCYNRFDLDIAKERTAKIVEDTFKYCKMHGVKKLNILNMGDMIQGNIHVNGRISQQINVIEQVIAASEILSQALNQLQNACEIVTYRSVVDNHSRLTPNKEDHIEQENFNKLIDFYLEERLKQTRIKFMHDNLDDGVGKFRLINGKNIIFAHGHQDSKNQSIQNFMGMTREFIDYVLLAHFHSSATKSFQGSTLFINGSLVGTEDYAFGRRLFNRASQKLLIFEDENVIDINIDLQSVEK